MYTQRFQLEPHLTDCQIAHDFLRPTAYGQHFDFTIGALNDIAAQISCATKDLLSLIHI